MYSKVRWQFILMPKYVYLQYKKKKMIWLLISEFQDKKMYKLDFGLFKFKFPMATKQHSEKKKSFITRHARQAPSRIVRKIHAKISNYILFKVSALGFYTFWHLVGKLWMPSQENWKSREQNQSSSHFWTSS